MVIAPQPVCHATESFKDVARLVLKTLVCLKSDTICFVSDELFSSSIEDCEFESCICDLTTYGSRGERQKRPFN